MALSNIAVLPVEPCDFLALARIEAEAFEKDVIGAQIFGPRTEATINFRASTFGKPGRPGEVQRYAKAVTADADGKEEIVGFASWCQYTPPDVAVAGDDMEMKVPPVPCPELFRDVIIKGDELMRKSSGGKGYLMLNILATSPRAQRRGVGTQLLEDGLREADATGMQAVLVSSKMGEPLYRKHGFLEYEVMTLNLSEYEGEGKGSHQLAVMNRPARSVAS